ncbi:MAG: guanylate kinase [Erysipelotrichaceae bacterium]|nr:guanylate kinase [Erysipelotrichaceae bacterium]
MKKGLLIIFSGPSGVGKGTVRKLFMDDPELNLAYSISMTSRAPREGEKEGVDYYYVTKERFQEAIDNDEMLEYAQFVGNFYGTPRKAVEEQREQGKNVILEIEVDGAQQVMRKCPDALSIFLIPPSMEELENRIRGRKTETEEVIQERLTKARKEMKTVDKYKYVVCNDDAQLAADIVAHIIKSHIRKSDE